ncbi:hypothetical protein [Trebonia sp.]|uniref:hypothetical protein n=1 Tax=Trebonia sp. TaxID=2767075 RepID=UPI00345B6C72
MHKAAAEGNLELAQTLLQLGAGPSIRVQLFRRDPRSAGHATAASRPSSNCPKPSRISEFSS